MLERADVSQAKRIELDALLPHLQPSDEALRKSIPAALLKLEAIAKEVNSTAFGGGKPEVWQAAIAAVGGCCFNC